MEVQIIARKKRVFEIKVDVGMSEGKVKRRRKKLNASVMKSPD